MNTQRDAIKVLAALVLVAVTLCASTPASAAPPDARSGMFGVARGEVARINVVNVGDPRVGPIAVEMQFLDMMGNVVARGSENVMPGQAAFFDVPFDTFPGDGNRVETRVVIMGLPPRPLDPNLRITIEVFNVQTGSTIHTSGGYFMWAPGSYIGHGR